MEIFLIIIIIIQGMGLIPFMFYFNQDKSKEWDREDMKVVSIAQIPIDAIMLVSSVLLFLYTRNPDNLSKLQIFIHDPSGIIGSYLTFNLAEILILSYIVVIGIAAWKNPQTRKSSIFLFSHITSMLIFIITFFILT